MNHSDDADPIVPPTGQLVPPTAPWVPPTRAELSLLFSALCDETITPAEMARLDELLVHDKATRQAYREMIGVHVGLQFSFQSPSASADGSEGAGPMPVLASDMACDLVAPPNPPLVPGWSGGFSMSVLPLFVLLAVLVGVIAWSVNHAGLHVPPGQLGRETASDSARGTMLARLHFNEGCRWADGGEEYEPGMSLVPGQTLDLVEGAATIEYESGVRLVIEGPARLTLCSTASARLDCGKCFASVPPPNQGFRISTPFAEVIDQGTEFGVMASDKGYSDVGVFKGKVECFALDHGGACVDRVQLHSGQAARLNSTSAEALPGVEAVKSSFPSVVKSPQGVRAYWRFEEEPPLPPDGGIATQVNAVCDSSGNSCRLDFWPGGKSGVGQYRSSSDVPPAGMFRPGYDGGRRSFDCGALSADASGVAISTGNHGTAAVIENGFTVEGFFKTHGDVSGLKPMTLVYQGEKNYSYLVGLNKVGKGTLSFFVFGHVNKVAKLPVITLTDKNFADGSWHYFAARYEPVASSGRFQLKVDVLGQDGRHYSASADVPEGFKIASSTRPMLVGRQQYFAHQRPKAHFAGLIDEIRIASRPLADNELLGRISIK